MKIHNDKNLQILVAFHLYSTNRPFLVAQNPFQSPLKNLDTYERSIKHSPTNPFLFTRSKYRKIISKFLHVGRHDFVIQNEE